MKYDDGFDPTPYDRILSGMHMNSLSQIDDDAGKTSAEEYIENVNEEAAAKQSGEENVQEIEEAYEDEEWTEEELEEAIAEFENAGAAETAEAAGNAETAAGAEEILEDTSTEHADAAEANGSAPLAAESGEMQTDSLSQIDDINQNEQPAPITELTEAESGSSTAEPVHVSAETGHEAAEPEYEISEPVYEGADSELADTEPASAPVFAPLAEEKETGAKISLENLLIANELNFTEIKDGEKTRVYIEEDILVPDIKPDMAKILSMDGNVKCADREIKSGQKGEDRIKVTGDITLETIYIPEKPAAEPIVTIQSRIPFRTEWGISTAPFSSAVIKPEIESIDYMVINERKFRAKLTVSLTMREYAGKYIELFEGIRGEDIEVLKEKVNVTDILVKKKDVLDIEENLLLKENSMIPGRILKYGINVVENHKQISPEKAVINGTVYCNILYLAEPQNEDIIETSMEADEFMDEASSDSIPAAASVSTTEPAFYQGKIEFTQFIPLNIESAHSGSRITFDGSDLSVRIKNFSEDDEEASGIGFAVEGSINTNIEIYKNVEAEIVTDVYHNEKELAYDSEPFTAKSIAGSGVTELSAREILNIPAQYNDIEQIIYITGKVQNAESVAENGKETVSGTIDVEILAIAADEDKTPFKMQHSLPFRGSMDIAGAQSGMIAESDIYVKELWFDKINNKQIEVNAGILALGTVSGHDECSLIKNPVFIQSDDEGKRKASMIIYISRPQDDLWSIAKKFRTTRERISRINGLDADKAIAEGTKLLIIK